MPILDNITTRLSDDLEARLKTVELIKKQTVTMYKPRQIYDVKKTLGLPAVGVFYVGATPLDDKGKTAEVVFDVVLIGGDQCKGDSIPAATEILDLMRQAVLCNPTSVAGKEWKWKLEAPHQLDADLLGYVQRWGTNIVLRR